jgi:hypothetical protein
MFKVCASESDKGNRRKLEIKTDRWKAYIKGRGMKYDSLLEQQLKMYLLLIIYKI